MSTQTLEGPEVDQGTAGVVTTGTVESDSGTGGGYFGPGSTSNESGSGGGSPTGPPFLGWNA